ncbi:MAG: hypothetical protein K2X77_13725 [Candidatus Obscuribacterales bacterium]|jgi:hypothetical protein|nr:hypothetical protein [Candidatus Obscuribacterales bacterium]
MRVELVYTPGCTSYRKALHLLETVIAEERLPIYVELQVHEGSEGQTPCIKVDGEKLSDSAHQCVEELRGLISRRWNELTAMLSH